MPWLELSLTCTADQSRWMEQALNDLGALSVTLMDADAQTPDESAILEPGVGETPVWAHCTMTALFDAGTPQAALLDALEAIGPDVGDMQPQFRDVDDQDWERAWIDQFQPMQFGRRTWIVPWNHELPAHAGPDSAVVRLDPGLAFGSGTHATTALCLEWLDGLNLKGTSVLDYGCGSGILALAALKLGADTAVGIDIDPQAVQATNDNALRNELADRLRVYLPHEAPEQTFPVVVANILASALDALAENITSYVQAGGVLAMSGILKGQESELIERYDAWFEHFEVFQREDWICISARRKSVQ